MKVLALASVALAAVAASVEASTCTADNIAFLSTTTGQTCTLYNPVTLALLSKYQTTLTATASIVDISAAGTQAVINPLLQAKYGRGANFSLPLTATALVSTWGYSAQQAGGILTFINFTLYDQACNTFKTVLKTINTCFNKNCTAVATAFCANLTNPPAVLVGSTVASVGAGVVSAAKQTCGGAAQYYAAAGVALSLVPSISYDTNCTTLFNPADFGTFVYNTTAPTKAPSSGASFKAGIVAVASVFAAALAF
jgi:hypothetical protein